MCARVFQGGKSLVVTVGPTYLTSLWCLLEPFVHLSMATSDQSRRPPPTILMLGADRAARDQVRDTWHCDVSMARCSRYSDSLRIQRIMGLGPGGIHEFNRYIHDFAKKLEGGTWVKCLDPQ